MIRIDVNSYCDECPYFEPDVERSRYGYEGKLSRIVVTGDTVVRCTHRWKCEGCVERAQGKANIEEQKP